MSAKIATALHEVMSKVGYVQKTGKNTFHGYRYAGEADLLEKLRPAMVEAGLLLIPSVRHVGPVDQFGNVSVEVEYTLVHKDGDIWPEKVVGVGCGNDKSPKTGRVGDKGVYKAITGANKYVLFKIFQIETGDDPERDEQTDQPLDAAAKSATARPADPPAVTKADYDHAVQLILTAKTLESLGDIWRSAKVQAVATGPEPFATAIRDEKNARKSELSGQARAA